MGGGIVATLKDISRHLNLSVTQVSRALNDHSDVNEDTRRKVKEAARTLKYHPNITARKLASGRSGMVGLVMTHNPDLGADGMWLEIVSGLSTQFSGRGMQFVLHVAQPSDSILPTYQKLISAGTLDGFVLVEPYAHDMRVDFLAALQVPFVLHGRVMGRSDYPYFDIDNHGLAYDSARYLIGLGHRRIANINGLEHRSYVEARNDGYRAALLSAGLPVDTSLIRHGEMTAATGLVNAVQLFDGPGTGPTAIICANLLIAQGVYQALGALGLSVPQDVSVIAHDDALIGVHDSAFFPALTVTRSPLRDSWQPLAEFLTSAIQGKPLAELQKIAQYQFIERGSTGPASA